MKIFYMGKEVRDAKGRFSSFKLKVKNFFKTLFFWAFIGGCIYGAFNLGKYTTESKVTFAKEIIEVKDESLPPVLARICKAESGNRQFREDGRVLRGAITPSDIGFCQINETYHNDDARKMGIDIYTEEGNKKMAKWIFENQGTSPWNASKCSVTKKTNCWK